MLTTKDFINRATSVHGDKYDYSSSIYNGCKKQIEIICYNHGVFKQMAQVHWRGYGCPACSGNKKLSTKEFIDRAIKIHGTRYSYSKSQYKSLKKEITIICKKHGEFKQIADNHLSGANCPYCSHRIIIFDELVDRFNNIHDSKYKYNNAIYKDMFTKIAITCPKHKIFQQTPSNHLKGHGCVKCTVNTSKMEQQWLDEQRVPVNNRNVYLNINNKRLYVDGLDLNKKIVYEFYGDFWHGNPNVFNENDINTTTKKTFGELYKKTIEREDILQAAGYDVVSMWESDWIKT